MLTIKHKYVAQLFSYVDTLEGIASHTRTCFSLLSSIEEGNIAGSQENPNYPP